MKYAKILLIPIGIIVFIIAWICSIVEENSKPNYLYSHYNYSSSSSIPSSYECFLLGKHTVERVCSGLSPLRRDRLWC